MYGILGVLRHILYGFQLSVFVTIQPRQIPQFFIALNVSRREFTGCFYLLIRDVKLFLADIVLRQQVVS